VNEDRLADLLAIEDVGLQAWIDANQANLETVEALKSRSAQFYFDQPAEALRVAQVAFRLGRLLPAPAAALGCWTLANALLFVDRYKEASELFEQACAEYLRMNMPLEAARAGVGWIWALIYTGEFERAIDLAHSIEPVLAAAAERDPADRRRLGGLYNNLGILYDVLGQYEESLASYDQKLSISRLTGNALDAARTQQNRGCVLTYLNMYDEALIAFREAEQGFTMAGARADLARLDINRGILYAFWQRYDEAEAALARSDQQLAVMEGMEQQRHVLTVYRALVRIQSMQTIEPMLATALVEAQIALAQHGPPFEEGLAWLGLGYGAMARSEWDEARYAFEQMYRLAQDGAGRPLAWLALHGLGRLAELKKEFAQAIVHYEAAIDQIELVRQGLQVETFRAGFLADKLRVYQDLALLQLRLGRPSAAFAVIERAKSRLLVERLAGRLQTQIAAWIDSPESEVRTLAQQLQTALAELETLYRTAHRDEGIERGNAWPQGVAPSILVRVQQLEETAQRLIRQIEREQPRFSSLSTGYVTSLDKIRGCLQNALFVQYAVIHGQVWSFVVDGNGIRDCRQLVSRAQVEAIGRRLTAAIERALGLSSQFGQEMLSRYLPSLQADADAQLAALFDMLIHPLSTSLCLENTSELVISPDGLLHHIPFHALLDSSGSYLIEKCAVSLVPSGTILELCAQPRSTNHDMLAMGYGGDQLVQIQAELSVLKEMFPTVDVWSSEKATAEHFVNMASRYGMIHLASHAHFRSDQVMLSFFTLADRPLTLAEIIRLRLNAELVTLSGCETGRGRLHGGDLISLAGSFLGAGARSLLVSLWRVDDSVTARLMGSFYRAIQNGVGRAQALRLAQLELLNLAREQPGAYGFYRHPAYWAPFVLIGERGKINK